MKRYRVIIIEYGQSLGLVGGAYDHPDGGTCALCVKDISEFDDAAEALSYGIEQEEMLMVHQAIVEEFHV